MPDDFQEAGGCLTSRALAALRDNREVPPGVLSHMVACESCQKRALEVDAPRVPGPKTPRPTLGRMLFYIAAIVIAAFLAFVSMFRLG